MSRRVKITEGNIEQIRNMYQEVQDETYSGLGIHLPFPNSIEIVSPFADQNLTDRALNPLDSLTPNFHAFVKLDDSGGTRLCLPYGRKIGDRTLVHEGAHLWHYQHNPATRVKPLQRRLMEGWATRVTELFMDKRGELSLGERLSFRLASIFPGCYGPYEVGRNYFAEIGSKSGWEGEIAAAKVCASDKELFQRACGQFSGRRLFLII